jgi:hypothetical protein
VRQFLNYGFSARAIAVAGATMSCFPSAKQRQAFTGTRSQVAAAEALDALVPGANGAFSSDCLRLMAKPLCFGANDFLGINWKDTVLRDGTPTTAWENLGLQAQARLGAEIYVQSLTWPDESQADAIGWLPATDIPRLGAQVTGADGKPYWRVALDKTYEMVELLAFLQMRYP